MARINNNIHGLLVGQQVLVVGTQNYTKHINRHCEINKIGREWFTLKEYPRDRWNLQDLSQDDKGYSSSYQIYLTEQDLSDTIEYNKLWKTIHDIFDWSKSSQCTLDQLRNVAKILKINILAAQMNEARAVGLDWDDQRIMEESKNVQ